MGKQITALERLLKEGFFKDKSEALPYFLSGAVYCGVTQVKNGGQLVPADALMNVRGLNERYISKGGYKLEGAIKDFGIQVSGRACIDAGACTGGFTDCLIKHGAALVYAVEVGYGQLAGSLAQDARVVNLERTNIGDESLLALEPVPVFGSVDLSYLSLVKAVPQFRAVMHGAGELCCLVKPLFEIDDADARRTGEIDDGEYRPLLMRLISELNAQEGTSVIGVTHSHVTGNNGTREFFLHISFDERGDRPSLDEAVTEAVGRALSLERYRRE